MPCRDSAISAHSGRLVQTFPKYPAEEVVRNGKHLTLRLLQPAAALPQAIKIIASCKDGALVGLTIMAAFDLKAGEGTIAVLSDLDAKFGARHKCPNISEEQIACAIYGQGQVFAVFTGAESEAVSDEYALAYSYVENPAEAEANIRALRTDR